jgi:hypothetical protein
MTISGAELRPGFVAPKMVKNCARCQCAVGSRGWTTTYGQDDQEEKVAVGDIVELVVKVLGHKTQGGVFGGTDFVPFVLCCGSTSLIEGFWG